MAQIFNFSLFFISSFLILAFAETSGQSSQSESCVECLWRYTGDEYYACIKKFCRSALPELEQDLSNQEIDRIVLKATALEPNSILEFGVVIENSCLECGNLVEASDYFLACYQRNCRSEAKTLVSSADPASRCGKCQTFSAKFEDQEHLSSCAVFHCREGIKGQMSLLSASPQSLSDCTDWCYDQYLESGLDYSKCVKKHCTKKTIGLKYDSSSKDTEKCNRCSDITHHDYLAYCLRTYCREEVLQKLVKVKPTSLVLGCVDCSDYYENGLLDQYEECIVKWCRGDLAFAAFEYFSQTGLTLGDVQDKCATCDQFRQDSSRFSTCLMSNCKETALKRGVYFNKVETSSGLMDCVDLCTGEEALRNENCYSGTCHDQLLTLFDFYLAKVDLEKSYKCSTCFNGLAHECLIKSCRDEISGKSVLFSKDHPIKFSPKCSTCLYFEGSSYLSCIKYHCKEELEVKASFVLADNNRYFKKSQSLTSKTCRQCGEHYNQQESSFQYLCIVNKCESFLTSNSLIKQSSSPGCQKCGRFSGDSFKNCASFACKTEILSLFNDYKSKNNIQVSPLVKLNECTDSCYYDWYYYGYDYKTCAYEYCRSFEPMKAPSSSSIKLNYCTDNCYYNWYYYGYNYMDCILYYCSNSCTDSCYFDWYYYGYDYMTCILTYCRSSDSPKAISFSSNNPEKCHSICYDKTNKGTQESEYCLSVCKSSKSLEDAQTSLISNMVDSCARSCPVDGTVICETSVCEKEKVSLVSSSSLRSNCKACEHQLKTQSFTEAGFRLCVALNCKAEFSKEIKIQKLKVQEKPEKAKIPESGLVERCAEAFGVEVEDVDQKMCFRAIRSAGLESVSEEGRGYWMIGLVALAAACFAYRVSKKVFVSSPELEYRLI